MAASQSESQATPCVSEVRVALLHATVWLGMICCLFFAPGTEELFSAASLESVAAVLGILVVAGGAISSKIGVGPSLAALPGARALVAGPCEGQPADDGAEDASPTAVECEAPTIARQESVVRFKDCFQLGEKLGEGTYGQVRVARQRNTPMEHAVKIIDVRERGTEGEDTSETEGDVLRKAQQEIKAWRHIGRHEHCVALIQSFVEESLVYMVMEKCACSLMDRLVSMPMMTEGDLACTFREMLLGISHIHSKMIVHRDIKPDNFLYGGPLSQTVKLCDFGLAKRLPKAGGKLKGRYGTAPYMSPEMLAREGYDRSTDVWSFAATAYLMIFGDFPYMPKEASPSAMKQAILDGVPEPSFGGKEDGGPEEDNSTGFVKVLLQRRAEDRPGAAEALELPFLRPKEEDLPLRANITRARKLTSELKPPVQPSVHRGLDELLLRLQESSEEDVLVKRCSESFAKSTCASKKDRARADRRIAGQCPRSQNRRSTHSGIIGIIKERQDGPESTDDGPSASVSDSGSEATRLE
uniref:Protein kinase domain-containing protein n=1 Tax=Pyrodinium bahamense TaxID=73915 RepID=A0A7S0FV85_9DINO